MSSKSGVMSQEFDIRLECSNSRATGLMAGFSDVCMDVRHLPGKNTT